MLKQEVKITNSAGLHARPAASLVKLASDYKSEFYIQMQGYTVNGKSILGVMTLAAEKGAKVELQVDGPDEEEAMEAIVDLFERGFDEE